jgi:PAS domain-containing protein
MTTTTGIFPSTQLSLFDIIPFWGLVVDEDVRILHFNAAAVTLFGGNRDLPLRRRTGDLLHCLHAADHADGCGRGPFCKDCIVRNAVAEAYDGNQVIRRRAKLQFLNGDMPVSLYALITASPFIYEGLPLCMLLIEDIREIAELQRMIPMCCKCRKVRDEQDSWIMLENYFKTTWDVDFSHGYCPACLAEEMKLL